MPGSARPRPRRSAHSSGSDAARWIGGVASPTSVDVGDDLKTRISWLYHMEGMTQDEVAQVVGVNRSRVLRILAAARADGTVQVRVTTRFSRCVELERALEERWGLDRAIVVPHPQGRVSVADVVGCEMGAYLNGIVRPGITLGLGWGRTLSSGLPSIEPRAADGVRVISMLGGLTRVSAINPSEFAWRVADRLSAECSMLAAPVFAPNPHTREALLGHGGLGDVFDRARRLDVAVVSTSGLSQHSTVVRYGLLTHEEVASLERAGAVGDVLCHYVNAEGELVDHPINERVVAVHPHDLRSARRLVLASGGRQKVAAIRAALKLLRPSTLVTDEVVAERLTVAGH